MTADPRGGADATPQGGPGVTWTPSHCDVCGGLGAAVEQRVVGDVMVDEAGHKWIASVRRRNPALHQRMVSGFLRKLERDEPEHPWVNR